MIFFDFLIYVIFMSCSSLSFSVCFLSPIYLLLTLGAAYFLEYDHVIFFTTLLGCGVCELEKNFTLLLESM